MADDPHSKDDDNDAGSTLPLPEEVKIDHNDLPAEQQAAADLIRRRVESAYQSEPDATTEALEAAELEPVEKLSRHQQFIYDLTTSGTPMHDINAAWREYYAGLADEEKHQVWR